MGWQRTAPNGDRLGITIFEAGELGGPGFGGCPQGRDYAVTAFSRPSIKIGHDGVTVSGTHNDATEVQVTLVDGVASNDRPVEGCHPQRGHVQGRLHEGAGERSS